MIVIPHYRHLENNTCTQNAAMSSNIPVNALNDKEKKCVLDLLHRIKPVLISRNIRDITHPFLT